MFKCALFLMFCSFYLSSLADDENDYTVWADKLNVRESAGVNAKTIAVLEKNDRVSVDWFENWTLQDGYHWVKIKFEGKEGWIAKLYIFPTRTFQVLSKANELGKAGKADEMVAELKKEFDVIVSPDMKKAVFEESSLFDWQGGGPVAYFNSGEGIADYIPAICISTDLVRWSADSRYLVGYYSPVYYGILWIYDTSQHEVLGTSPHTAYLGAFAEESYEFIDGYLVWVAVEEPRSVAGFDDVMLPYLVYYDLKSKTIGIALTYDIQTIRKNKDGYAPEVKLIKNNSVPFQIMSSPLYKRCLNQYVKTAISEA